MNKTRIDWTNMVWNPVRGCKRVSEGCEHCYAERQARRFFGHLVRKTQNGSTWGGNVDYDQNTLLSPLRRKKPVRIFVDSMGDLFFEEVSDQQIDMVFGAMAACPQHTFMVLTKRPDRMLAWATRNNAQAYIEGARRECLRIVHGDPYHGATYQESLGWTTNLNVWNRWPLPNVWLGVSAENQARANERIPQLLRTPGAVRFVSCEPLLGPIDLTAVPLPDGDTLGEGLFSHDTGTGLDWVIVGGETGPGARPMHPDWARSLRDQAFAAKTPFFFKHWGEWLPEQHWNQDAQHQKQRIMDGKTWDELPGAQAATT